MDSLSFVSIEQWWCLKVLELGNDQIMFDLVRVAYALIKYKALSTILTVTTTIKR